jgi:hypothetical protein
VADPAAGRPCVVVAPFFPPSGLPPAHRARLFVRHLPTFGWIPTVVTVEDRDREEPPEPALEATIPEGVRIERVRAWPAPLTRAVGIGDLGLRALGALAARTIRVARASPGGVVLLIVPPWYLLWLAPLIRRFARVPVVVDYVDPWRIAAAGTAKSRLAGWVAARSEGHSLRAVSGVFAVSDPIVADVRARFPWLNGVPAGAAPYGFEASDLLLVAAADRDGQTGGAKGARTGGGAGGPYRLVYVGAISDAQLPVVAAVLAAVSRLRARNPEAAARLRIELYGTTYAPPHRAAPRVAHLVAQHGLADQVHEHPARIPYVDALTMAARADANLVLGDITSYYAASKLMPVLAARRPVIAVLHADTEPASVLRRLEARGLVCYGTADVPSPGTAVEGVASVLFELIQGRVPVVTSDFAADEILQGRTAAQMTAALAAVLDQATAGRVAAP